MEIEVSVELDKKKFKRDLTSLLILSFSPVIIFWVKYKKFEKKYIGDFFDDKINWKRVGKAIFLIFSPVLFLMILFNL